MSFFLDFTCLPSHSTARQCERAALTIYRALEARNAIAEQAIGGGSAPAPVRTPRTQRRTSARKPAGADDDGDSSGEPERRRYSHIPSERLLRLPQVLETVGVKKTLLYQLVKDGEFPQPRKVRHLSLWPESEVQQWVRTVMEPKEVG